MGLAQNSDAAATRGPQQEDFMRIGTATVAIMALALFALPAMAQMGTSTTTTTTTTTQRIASASNGQAPMVEISSAGAPTTDLNMAGYEAFDQFAQEHPEIIRDLHHNRRLVNDPGYARNHPAYASFLQAHPKVAEDLAENPGNYLNGKNS